LSHSAAWSRLGLWTAVLSMLVMPAVAQPLCIRCTGPDATYVCRVENWQAPAADPRLRLYCITEIARAAGHQSCAAVRTETGPCEGQELVLAGPGGVEPAAAEVPRLDAPDQQSTEPLAADDIPPVASPAPPGETAAAPAAPADGPGSADDTINGGPSSAIGNAAKSAGEALSSAGKAAGEAAKKSWDCLTSLFSDC
jgi:hypothetical protein